MRHADGETRRPRHRSGRRGEPHTYCTYCYQNGAFTYDATMEEQIEHNLNCAPELYSDRERAREQMRAYFPTLKRWKK